MLLINIIDLLYERTLHGVPVLFGRAGEYVLIFCEVHPHFLIKAVIASLNDTDSTLRLFLDGVTITELWLVDLDGLV